MAMSQEQEKSQKQHRVVIVGAGFAGFNAARELSRLARRHDRDRADQLR